MIELSQTILTKDRVLVPKGVRLTFKNGIAKYQGHVIERNKVPLQAIKGSDGPFKHAACAIVLNDNKQFQEVHKKQYKDYMHVVALGDNLFVYIWDTRKVVDVITGLNEAVKGYDIKRTIVSKTTGVRQEQILGRRRFGWAKSLYEMILWPVYHRPDNGLPLVTDNDDWKDFVDQFNATMETKFAYECDSADSRGLPVSDPAYDIAEMINEAEFTDAERKNLAASGLAMPDGSYPIRNLDDLENAIKAYGRTGSNKEETKQWIVKRANDLNATYMLPESW